MPASLQKRPNDLFISYGHADRAVVEPVAGWLRQAGLRLWFDVSSGSAARRTTDLLTRGIESARGALFFISPNWAASAWCRDEHEVALLQRRGAEDFVVIAARIADAEVPAWFQASQVLDLRRFDPLSATELLRSLTPNPPSRVDSEQDVYYSGPWSNRSRAAENTLRALNDLGWRLVGDSQDQPRFAESARRIETIISSSRGLVAVLPFRPDSQPHRTSPWVLDEVRIAQRLDRPCLLITEQGVTVPGEVAGRAFGGRVLTLTDDGPDEQTRGTLQAFDDTLGHTQASPAGTYSFFAASLLEGTSETDVLTSVIERVTNMTCVRGWDLIGQHAQEAIISQIRGAAFVIADITDDSRNALIEAGIARGADVPLHLICRLPATGSRKTRFMLQDMEVHWYASPLEQIGAIYRTARRYRRRVLAPPGL